MIDLLSDLKESIDCNIEKLFIQIEIRDRRINSLKEINQVLSDQVEGLLEGIKDYEKQIKALRSPNES